MKEIKSASVGKLYLIRSESNVFNLFQVSFFDDPSVLIRFLVRSFLFWSFRIRPRMTSFARKNLTKWWPWIQIARSSILWQDTRRNMESGMENLEGSMLQCFKSTCLLTLTMYSLLCAETKDSTRMQPLSWSSSDMFQEFPVHEFEIKSNISRM